MLARRSVHQRGSAKAGCLIAAGVGLVLVLIQAFVLVGRYNSLVGMQETTEAAWSEIDNQYKRRFDLIPQLVSTVKGAANFEKSTLQAVTEARASVMKTKNETAGSWRSAISHAASSRISSGTVRRGPERGATWRGAA